MGWNKEHIVAEIQRTAAENNGRPLGIDRFLAETGIRPYDWGRFWARWSTALSEAGFKPNQRNTALPDERILSSLVVLVRELGHFPVLAEIRLRKLADSHFPSPKVLQRFGGSEALRARLRAFCLERGEADLLPLLASIPEAEQASVTDRHATLALGHVYLLKGGRFYKIGRTNAAGRRERELQIQLPEKAKVVHSIKTDDPVGIEAYWHRRFEDRRQNGEWFALTAADVSAFRRRKFM
jgi:hypothetical protein